MQSIKIALCGPHGSGKTSIFKELQTLNSLKDKFTFISSPTREVLKLDSLTMEEKQTYLATRHFVISNKGYNLIQDRCILDTYCYSKCLNITNDTITKCISGLPNFTHIFLFEPLDNIIDDGERWTSTNDARRIFKLMDCLLNEYNIKYTLIKKTTTIEERTKEIANEIIRCIK